MNYFFGIFLFVFSFVPVRAQITFVSSSGIYLLADSNSISLYPNKKISSVNDPYGHAVKIIDMLGPFFDERDMYQAHYEKALDKEYEGNYIFDFAFVERGNVKFDELFERNARVKFVFVFGWKAVAFGKMPEKDYYNKLQLKSVCSFGEIDTTFHLWAESLHENYEMEWRGDSQVQQLYYTNDSLAVNKQFWNGRFLEERKWYYNRKIKSISYDSSGYKCLREYSLEGELEHLECKMGYGDRSLGYSKWYFSDDKSQRKDTCYIVGKNYHNEECIYDSTGSLTDKYITDFLPFLSGETGEFNNPMVLRELHFEKNVLVSDKESYTNCGECSWENTGTWKFYKDGVLVSTEKNPSWKSYYNKGDKSDK
jgi:hypothetical protein